MDVSQYQTKINKLLIKFLEPDYKLGNDVYLNILLSHLSGKDNEIRGAQLRKLPLFSDWLTEAVLKWESTLTTPSQSIATFTLNLAALISKDETNFIKLNDSNIYLRLCKILRLRTKDIAPSTKLGYLKMLTSFINHKSGLDWLTCTDCWNDILSYCLENQTIYITREGYIFMYELLNKSINTNLTFCEMVVKKTMLLLESEQFNKNGVIKSEIDDYQIQKDLTPTLKLITYILEQSYMNRVNKKLGYMYLNDLDLENVVWKLLLIARDHEFIYDISKVIFLASFMHVSSHTYITRESALPRLKEFGRKFSNLFNFLINKMCVVEVLKLCCLGHNYWTIVDGILPPSEKKEPILFENQIIIFQIMPMIIIAFAGADKQEIREDELTELFINKLFKISCEHTIRLAYTYRTSLMTLDVPKAYDVAHKSVFYLMRIRKHLHRERAVIAFQAIAYALKYLASALIRGEHCELKPHQSTLLSAMMEGIGQLIGDFRITWTDSVESICITSLALDFLSCAELPARLCVQAMQLTHLTVAHFMPPNLALLVNEIRDSSVQKLAMVIRNRLTYEGWEVRDSALETLLTVVDISSERFPPFQQLVLEAGLCELTADLATSDEESFVRASAVRTLSSMVRCGGSYWQRLEQRTPSLLEEAQSVLTHEPEALVRCEAARLVRDMHSCSRITETDLTQLYSVMSWSACEDLHWETRVAALDFWELVIERELSEQGMLDGAFPPVTFSRERKIVQLTEREIRTRLDAALIRLSYTGCLNVIMTTASDSCDLQVARRAVNIANKLSLQLRKYNMLESNGCFQALTDVPNTYKASGTIVSINGENKSDSVIESIVASNDVNLLASVFSRRVGTNVDVRDSNAVKVCEPDVFKRFLAQDLDAHVRTRSDWLAHVTDDLGSLLDDILQSYEDNDVNAMDCY